MNAFETRYELDRVDGGLAVRRGFCIVSDKFMKKLLKAAEKDRMVDVDFTSDQNITFFSEKGFRAVVANHLSPWPLQQEPLNLAHWQAVVEFDPGKKDIRINNTGNS